MLHKFFLVLLIFVVASGTAAAHVSEQALALLLPTNIYILTGCIAVLISIVIVSVFPANSIRKIFKPIDIRVPKLGIAFDNSNIKIATSVCSLLFVVTLAVIGFIGTRDPLANLLPLSIWTLWWIAIVTIHIIIGNLWHWINPWTGLYTLLLAQRTPAELILLPRWVGCWPAVFLYIVFYLFIIADLAPDDPARLANAVLGYTLFTFIGMFVFGGKKWLKHVEFITVLCDFLTQISPIRFRKENNILSFGTLGWKTTLNENISVSHAFFLLTVLACGSFDGLNETFWWLDLIGINPLAFPGRSAVVWWSTGGLLVANFLLFSVFAFCIWLGVQLASKYPSQNEIGISTLSFKQVFCQISISILPIAAAYHSSHYLITLLVNGQYFIAAMSDPLANGSNLLRLENYQVTTGFLNSYHSVRRIWLTQASLIVIGHILAVLLAHHAIARLCDNRLQSLMLHTPLACFMASYTWFGLWLLASPRGL